MVHPRLARPAGGISGAAKNDCNVACQAARKAQDPPAPATDLLTDNAIGFGPTSDSTTYSYQLQPALTLEGDNANAILRGLAPLIGVPDGGAGTNFAWSSSIVRRFYVREVAPGAFRLGYGLRASFETAEKGFGGSGNCGSVTLVGFGYAGDLAYPMPETRASPQCSSTSLLRSSLTISPSEQRVALIFGLCPKAVYSHRIARRFLRQSV